MAVRWGLISNLRSWPLGLIICLGQRRIKPRRLRLRKGEASDFLPAADIPPDWWRLFHSRALNSVIQSAILANPSLEAAEANLRVAIANVRAQQGALFPTIGADFNPSRNRTATASISPTTTSGASIFTLFTAQATVNYTLDVFGGSDAQSNLPMHKPISNSISCGRPI